VIAESDSTETIQACTGEQSWWNEFMAIFADCIVLALHLGNVSFKFCPRKANQVAHELARDSFKKKILVTRQIRSLILLLLNL
jgi:hypothetical protein